MTKTGPIDISLLIEQRMDYESQLKMELEIENESLILHNTIAFTREMFELLDEWKQYKYWQRRKKRGTKKRQLEEYSDGLHFIMSLFAEKLDEMPGLLTYEYNFPEEPEHFENDEILRHIISIMECCTYLDEPYDYNYRKLLQDYMYLGYMLEFTWDEIVKAFLQKLNKNIKRLENGY